MDSGLWPANYFDCDNDDIAIQREIDLMDGVHGPFRDPLFPAAGRSLYFDPRNTPKGSIPSESLRWNSICEGALLNCDSPVLFAENRQSVIINQGALGNGYFANALRLLACEPRYIKRLLVSSKFASQGCYTWKFCKSGKWRYVHIDDRIPCRLSGYPNFMRNDNSNEIFAMLIEKAYAKLHGCYESLNFGLIEKIIPDLTNSAHVHVMKEDVLEAENGADIVWEALEQGFAEKKLIGCGRWLEDPYSENACHRQGLSLSIMYQVVDVAQVTAAATAELDALTVGMVCIRILQKSGGRYIGRWSYGHHLWTEYPAIGDELSARTTAVQRRLGLFKEETGNTAGAGVGGAATSKKDPIETQTSTRKQSLTSGSATANLLGESKKFTNGPWKLGEGFPEFVDEEADSLDIRRSVTRAVSKSQPEPCEFFWIQVEDFVDMFNRIYIVTDLQMQSDSALRIMSRRFCSKWIPGDFIAGSGGPPAWSPGEEDEEDEGSVGSASVQVKEAVPPPIGAVITPSIKLNDNFTDNPMYPFSVTEPSTVCISLYQGDRRWSMDRLEGAVPVNSLTAHFVTRRARLSHCMEYGASIGFLIVRLFGLKVRLTEFKLKKVIYKSDNIENSNLASCSVELRPGRYAIVPFTSKYMLEMKDYVLHCSYMLGTVEFEVDDVISQRLMDTELSEDEESDGESTQEGDNESANSSIDAANKDPSTLLPQLHNPHPWEFTEDLEENGIITMYDEVGCLSKYLFSLRKEVQAVDASIQETNMRLAALGPKIDVEPTVSTEVKDAILGKK